WDGLSVDRAHTRAAIGLMGCVVLAASAEGARTGGRSPLYQAVLAGFGLHTLTHLASAAVLRGYTPGVVTAPLVAAPFTLWARHRLRRAGGPTASGRSGAAPLALFPVVGGGGHGGAAGLDGPGRAPRRSPDRRRPVRGRRVGALPRRRGRGARGGGRAGGAGPCGARASQPSGMMPPWTRKTSTGPPCPPS